MSAVEQAKEPSMEEILASIRRIISEDDSGGESAEKKQAKAPEPVESEMAEAVDEVSESPAEDEEEVPDLGQDSVDALFDAPADDFASADDTADVEPEPEPEPQAEAAEPEDILELSQSDIVEDEIEDMRVTQPDVDDVCFDEGEDAAMSALAADPEPEPESPAVPDLQPLAGEAGSLDSNSALMSATTDAAVSAAFGNLANTILSNNARTLEDLVKEILSPMLKAWLDENLPTLVERLVREEIERVARGGR